MNDVNEDGYTRVRYLPSRFVPYRNDSGEVPEIFIRRMKLGEVEFLFSNKGHTVDILNYMAKREIIKGIPLRDLTVDDWSFIELTITAMTFTNTKFNIDGGVCPECGDEVNHVEYELPQGGTRRVEIKAQMKGLIIPSQISFKELDEDVEPPIEIELGGRTVQMDFFRLSHYIELEKEGFFKPIPEPAADADDDAKAEYEAALAERNSTAEKVRNQLLTGIMYEDLDIGDNFVINYAFEKMAHPVQTEFPTKCTKCGHTHTIRTSWEVMSFIPFRSDQRFEGDRIHFGRRTPSTNNEPPKPRLSSRPMALRQGSGDSKAKS